MLETVTTAGPRFCVAPQASQQTAPMPARAGPASADTHGRPLSRGCIIGRYLVLDEIGSGGMGVVYRAFDPELDRKVALKVVRPDEARARPGTARARLAREAQSLARLRHRNVVQVYDVGTHAPRHGGQGPADAPLFVAMELIEGSNLSQWLDSPAAASWRSIVRRFIEAGRGLAAAHEVGVVHRDFKPSNVLLCEDGRVCVTDFGLARAEPTTELPGLQAGDGTVTDVDLDIDPAVEREAAVGAPDAVSLTEQGRAVGTPGYMAPEQHAGSHPDPKADQYAFCVALFEALWGRRPFAGLRGRALVLAKRAGPAVIDFERPRHRTPRWVKEALVRGLQPNPRDRHRNLRDLLDLLERRLSRRRARLWPALGVTTIVAALGITLQAQETRQCTDAAAELVGVWDDAAKDRLDQAFEAGSGSPESLQTVTDQLDAYTQGWSELHAQACADTWIRGQQSRDLLDRRMACLHRRLHAVGATLDLLSEGDPELLRRSPEMVTALPPLEPCATLEDPPADPPRPNDPATAARLDSARRQLAVAQAQMAAARFEPARQSVHAIENATADLQDDAFTSELLLVKGRLLDDTGAHHEAADTLQRAVALARATGHRRIEAEAWLRLARVQGVRLRDEHNASFCADMAQAAVEALGDDPELHAPLALTRGRIAFRAGHDAQARRHFEEALSRRRSALPSDDYRVAEVLSWMAGVEQRQGNLLQAEAHLRRVIEIHRRTFGPAHPRLASATGNLGLVLAGLGRTDEALDAMQRGRAIFVSTFGTRHPAVAMADDSIGDLLRRTGRLDEAAAAFERSVGVLAEIDAPPTEPIEPLLGLAQTELARGFPVRALELLDQARDLAHGVSVHPVARGDIELTSAHALTDLNQPALAGPYLDAAEAHYQGHVRPEDDRLGELAELRGGTEQALAPQR